MPDLILHHYATSPFSEKVRLILGYLADGRAFFGGGEPSIADFSVAHPIWFIRRAPSVAGVLDAVPRLGAWYERVRALGKSKPSETLESAEALRIAAGAAMCRPRCSRGSASRPARRSPSAPPTTAATWSPAGWSA